MDRFRIKLSPVASRDSDAFEMGVVIRVLSELKILQENPFPRGKLVRKIKGKKTAFYRLRIDKFRVFFEILPMKVIILRILDKKEADRFIKRL